MVVPLTAPLSSQGASTSTSASASSARPPRPPLTILYASATGTAEDLSYRLSRLFTRHHFPVRVHPFSSLDYSALCDLAQHGGGPLVFLVATAGNGSFPPSAEPLWQELLRSSLPLGTALHGLQFAIFGLGDSSYPRYCWPERMLRKRLLDLGAEEVADKGEGDEQHYLGLEGGFQPFCEGLLEGVREKWPDEREPIKDGEPLPPTVELRFLDGGSEGGEDDDVEDAALSFSQSSLSDEHRQQQQQQHDNGTTRWLRLVRNERITSSSHWQDVRRLDFEVPDDSEPDLVYEAGDIAALHPSNDAEMVDALIRRMGWEPHRDRPVGIFDGDGRRIRLPRMSPPATSPTSTELEQHTTLHDYLLHYTSPFSPLRPSLFHLLRPFAPQGHIEREKLDEFCTPGEGYDDAHEYGVRPSRTAYEVLEEFKSVGFPPRYAPDIFGGTGGMRPREFSIASAPSESPRGITLVVAIVSYQTRIREPRRGVATRWIAQLEEGTVIPVEIRRSTFLRLPPSEKTPMIAVGPGTGMAPIRGLVRERVARARARARARAGALMPAPDLDLDLDLEIAPTLLFLGCRSFPDDALLHSEWADLAELAKTRPSSSSPSSGSGSGSSDGPSSGSGSGSASALPSPSPLSIHWASSRIDPLTSTPRPANQKLYVQHLLTSPHLQSTIWDLLSRGAWIYICGSSGGMPTAVRRAIEDVVLQQSGMRESLGEEVAREKAGRFVMRLESTGRWREECWS